jgi:hypothetical protein
MTIPAGPAVGRNVSLIWRQTHTIAKRHHVHMYYLVHRKHISEQCLGP